MRELARFVAEAKSFVARMQEIGGRLPKPEAAPFLFRQLERTLLQMHESILRELPDVGAKMMPQAEEKGGGLMDRVRKTFKRRRDDARDDIQKDIEEHLEEGLQGNTWTVPIPDLLAFLATGRKTGVLWVHDANETFLLQLDEGTLVHATSDGNPDRLRLGEVLVHLEKITKEALDVFIGALSEEAGFLGAELVDAGHIQECDLTDALTFQIQDMFRRLLASTSSIFRFQEGIRLMSRKDVNLNVQAVLLDILREADELTKALSVLDSDLEDSFLGNMEEDEQEAETPDEEPAAALPSEPNPDEEGSIEAESEEKSSKKKNKNKKKNRNSKGKKKNSIGADSEGSDPVQDPKGESDATDASEDEAEVR